MDKRIIDLYDDFTHGGMNRRAFLDRLAALAGQHRGRHRPPAGAAEQLRPGTDHSGERSAHRRRRRSTFPARRASRVIWSSRNPAASCRPCS